MANISKINLLIKCILITIIVVKEISIINSNKKRIDKINSR